jgi:membrane protein insertase Oxa1/YidC/SpoIIIJ
MTYEGAMWFTNLTVPDPWFALPIICGVATFLQFNSKRFKDQMLAQGGDAAGPMQKIMPFMGGFIIIAGCFQPSAIALLWASNSVISITQNYLMWHPKFRAYVGLPPMTALAASTSNSSQSFADLWKKATGAVDQQQQKQQPKPAEAAGAPPPGRLAVNYVSSKPRSRRPKS